MRDVEPSSLLPHRDVALYVRRVLESDAERITCEAGVERESPFRTRGVNGDVVPAYLGLEMGAQAAAAHEGVQRLAAGEDGRSTGGFVVRCRAAEFASPELDADATFTVTATLLEAAPPLRTYRVNVDVDGATLVRGDVSTFAD